MGRVFRGSGGRCRAIFPRCRDGAYRAMSFGTPFVGVGNERSDVPQRLPGAGRPGRGVVRNAGEGSGVFLPANVSGFVSGWVGGTERNGDDVSAPCPTSARARRLRSPDPVPCRMHSDSSDVPQTVPRRIRQGGLVHRLGTSATGRARKRFRTRSSEKNRPRRKPFLRGRDVVSGPDLGPDGGF